MSSCFAYFPVSVLLTIHRRSVTSPASTSDNLPSSGGSVYANPSEAFPPLIRIATNDYISPTGRSVPSRRPCWNSPLDEHGLSSQRNNSGNSRWPVQIPEEHRVNAYTVLFNLILMDWSLVFGERPALASQQSLYEGQVRLLDVFLNSVHVFETYVDSYHSAQDLLARYFPGYKDREILDAMILEILRVSRRPMTESEISIAIEKRWPLVTVGPRWDQLFHLIGAEEIYFCSCRPGGLEIKVEGLDIPDIVCHGDEAAFEQLKRKIKSSHNWVRDICLGLKGILPIIKIAATSRDDNKAKAQIGLQIQERVKEVFGLIDMADFDKALASLFDIIDSGHGGDDGAIRGNSSKQQDHRRQENSHTEVQSPEQALSPYSLYSLYLDSSITRDEFLAVSPPRTA
jgi:hypothetical protein